MKRYIKPLGIVAALMLVVGGLYGVDQLKAGEGCSSHTKAEATKVETANVQSSGKACCAAGKATTAEATGAASSCVSGVKAATAEATGTAPACVSGAKTKTAGASCGTEGKAGATTAELMSAEACMSKLAHCGIDVRGKDADMLAGKLVEKGCNEYSREQWASMIKSAQAMDAKEADAVFAKATSGDPCPGTDCPMKRVAVDLSASATSNN